MSELDRILAAIPECGDAVLSTVVHVKGSSYRRPGARMLILPDGRRIGSISGGCLEGDVCRKAWWFTEGGRPSVKVYDTSSDEDAVWEYGLGCNGIVHVLFERVSDSGTVEMLDCVAAARRERRPMVVATVIGTADPEGLPVGSRLLVDSNGIAGGRLVNHPVAVEVLSQARESLLRQKSHLAHLPGVDVFVEFAGAAPELVVFGAGHDAQPVVRMAAALGWQVTVADGRANYATAARFPEATRVVVMDPREPLRGIAINRDTLVVMMTHNFPQDARVLPYVAAAKPRYLGMLGPRSRTTDLLEETGVSLKGVDLHSPVGLDLGSDLPEAVALSIVSEIQAYLCDRSGGMLKHRVKPIHDTALESGRQSADLIGEKEIALCELA